ncbi:MAG: 5'-methylthioadenosine/S-adenosylhomocysteine nucleosidase [Clostridia bacterium]|nr:5'-methylthioadenosine/S-adenosylhomocysteine nucleosidase [Clostridia bacterium]
MKCFVIAMENEAAPVISSMKVESDEKKCGKRVICGTLFGEKVGLVICGVGKVNAGCGTQYAIDVLGADKIINIGVAGGLNDSLKIAGIYGISAAVQYDFDLTQLNGTAMGTLDEFKENYIPFEATGLYPLKKLGTGDRFNDNPEDYKLLTEVLKADIRDMEGGAIAQACCHAGVKCYSFKIISDLAGSGSTTEQYLNNLNLCFEVLKKELKNVSEACNG